MATSELVRPRILDRDTAQPRQITANTFALSRVLAVLASLRLTVALFAASIFLISLKTLAQKDQDVWRVVNDTYFRVWFAHVEHRVFGRLAQLFNDLGAWDRAGRF